LLLFCDPAVSLTSEQHHDVRGASAAGGGDTAGMSTSHRSLPDRWRIREDADLAWRFWDGEYVVHHALSNDTFRLSDHAGRVLRRLVEGGAETLSALAQMCEMSSSDLRSTLEELERLGFVARC